MIGLCKITTVTQQIWSVLFTPCLQITSLLDSRKKSVIFCAAFMATYYGLLKKQILLFILMLCVGCSATKNLKPHEALLFSQTIAGNKQIKEEELVAFFRQKPNRRLLKLPINPYVPIYFWGKQKYDSIKIKADSQKLVTLLAFYDKALQDEDIDPTKKQKLIAQREKKTAKVRKRLTEGNWLMRTVGEKPVLFDSVLMYKTASQLQLFLQQKGFFEAKVLPIYKIDQQRAKVVYQITENQAHTIRNISYQIADTLLKKLVLKDTLLRVFQSKQRYDANLLETERNRITRLFKEEGYFDFAKQFIFFKVDTVNPPPYQLDVQLIIENPITKSNHKKWEISEVIFTSDVNVPSDKVARTTLTFDGVLFKSYTHPYSNKILARRVRLRPSQFYSQTLTEDTQRALTLLEMFKFVNVKYDTVQQKLRANIYASPATKYSVTLEGGAEFNLNQPVPGPFGSLSFRNLNTFGGCEIFSFRVQTSLEAQGLVGGTNYQSQLLNVNSSLAFPRVVFPLPKSTRQRIEKYNPVTKFELGLQYENRPQVNRLRYQTVFGYNWVSKQQRHFYTFNLADISIVRTPFMSTSFLEDLRRQQELGNNFIFSFRSAFISSMSFAYTFNTYTKTKKSNSSYFRLFLESGGTTLNLLSKHFLNSNKVIFGDLSYYRFLKMQADFRYYIPTKNDGTWAFRCNLGLATPYGTTATDSVRVLPYEKYFFAGGGNSIRGWRPQRLGAGRYLRPDVVKKDGLPNNEYIEFGEMLLEMSIEYRKKLFGFVHGAAFIDAGNVWMLSHEANPNSLFTFEDFHKQIAVGGGLGLRFDFSFLILRFDAAMKLVEPGEFDKKTLATLGLPENYRKTPLFQRPFFGELVDWYFGIGYPF